MRVLALLTACLLLNGCALASFAWCTVHPYDHGRYKNVRR